MTQLKRNALACAILASSLNPAASASTATAFDLDCTVRGTYFDGERQEQFEDDLVLRYRIDLEEGRFCSGPCNETKPIGRVTPTTILLINDQDENGENQEWLDINRESGAFRWFLGPSLRDSIRMVGTCASGQFSGFPNIRF